MAHFSPIRPSYMADPYPALARLRGEAPVWFSEAYDAWLVTSAADCERVLRDPVTFPSGPVRDGSDEGAFDDPSGLRAIPPLVGSDGEHHRRLREPLNRAFSARAAAALEPFVASAVAGLLEPWRAGEPVEFVSSVAVPLARAVIGRQLGLAEDDRDRVIGEAHTMLAAMDPAASTALRAEARAARASLRSYLHGLREVPASTTDAGVLGTLAADRERLTDEELVSLAVDLVAAGLDVTTHALSHAVLVLGEHPAALSVLRETPEAVPGVVEEVLRYDTPAQVIARTVASEVRLGQALLRRGDRLLLFLGAANRDEAHCPRPDEFDIGREDSPHLSFALGPHHCIGAPLARLTLACLLRGMLERFEGWQVAPGGVERHGNFVLRGLRRLVIVPGT